MTTSTSDFDRTFRELTGHRPFPWQQRLFDEWLSRGDLPSAVSIPTGLGKTAVMAIWLLARAAGAALPRRLVYVVDRRAVVDQATEFAEQVRDTLQGTDRLEPLRRALGLNGRQLAISTLRGRYVDNREWMADPAAPAIIVGTVDMVGSRLLFEGYGISRRMRPFAAGLLGCDTLVLLDEAHLAHPFQRLLKTVENGQRPSAGDTGAFAGPAASKSGLPPPFRVLPLSATLGHDTDSEPFELNRKDRTNPIVRARLAARKSLTVETLASEGTLVDVLAGRAWDLMQAKTTAATATPSVAVYCHRREHAEKVAHLLEARARSGGSEVVVIRFVGGRRVRERQVAGSELEEHGLIGDGATVRGKPVFLVATSAGEVGVDLDCDHMVCDLVPWERMVQRLGRVNRRGAGVARVLVIDQELPDATKAGEDAVARQKAVRALLDALPRDADGAHQASPGALETLGTNPARSTLITVGTTKLPLYPPLTRPLVDAWAMTSLEDHAGRPEVAPWLRGWVEDDEPKTAVIWRRYLPLRVPAQDGAVTARTTRQIRAFFAAAPPQTAEILETETSRVVDWLKKRSRRQLVELKKVAAAPDQRPTIGDGGVEAGAERDEKPALPARLTPNGPIAFLLDSANRPAGTLSLKEIDNWKPRNLQAGLADKRLVVDARLGGLKNGLLNGAADEAPSTIEDGWGDPHNDFDQNAWILKVDVCANCEDIIEGWRSVLPVPYGETAEGEATSWLMVRERRGASESEDARAVARKAQRLDEHQQWTEEEAQRIADALGLGAEDTIMLRAAARHHDDGKAASCWQRAFGAMPEDGPFAKTTMAPNQHVLNGFRHEFKSALDAEKNGLDAVGRNDARFDLALHLIAAHHGNARPAIGVEGYDELPPSKGKAGARTIALRFARLQRQWGPWGLAWWESLLRAADQAASRRLDEETS